MHHRLALFAMTLAVTAGCAANSEELPSYPVPEGTYRLVGTLGAQPVEGRLVLTEEEVTFESNRGTCHEYLQTEANRERMLRNRGIGVRCDAGLGPGGGMNVGLTWDREGTLRARGAIPFTRLVRKRGPCARWSNDAARRCLEYEYTTEEVTEWASGPLTVFKEGRS